ncbi:hypothetical protein ACM61V_14140 [Sphingomonas sp. TX0543]|uniref:hypothetical protein n=1 Tax=unclassified Sphingomonas TaxID=196159 RepID=UPI0010F876D3|nr:hypothetical protein [Sphingomonas sp. 3P27F8]
MKDIGLALPLTTLGPIFMLSGIASVRKQHWRDSVPLGELLIDRIAGVEPPPRNRLDRGFARFQAWMNIVLGAFFTLCLVAVIISLLSE